MAMFEDVPAGHPFMPMSDGIVNDTKVLLKDPESGPEEEKGRATPCHLIRNHDGSIKLVPNGEPDVEFGRHQSVVRIPIHDDNKA